jgi:plasmid stabilization system protein ParE
MTRYRVEWLEDALQELAELWMTHESSAITEASNRVDELLSSNLAPNAGVPYGNSEGLRVLEIPPLRIIFSVNVSKRLVDIAAVSKSRNA